MYPNVDLSIQRSHQCKPVLCMAIAAWMLVDLCWCQEQQEGMLAAGEVLRAGATAWTAAGEAPAACHRPPRRCARREAVREAVVQEVRPPGETREEARAAEGPEERREEAPEAAQAGRQAGARARVDDAGGDGRDLERGRPAGGVSRRLGRLALEETLHGDAGHALVHGLRATVVIETLETNLAGTGACRDDRRAPRVRRRRRGRRGRRRERSTREGRRPRSRSRRPCRARDAARGLPMDAPRSLVVASSSAGAGRESVY